MCRYTRLDKIRSDHVGKKVQVRHVNDKLEKVAWIGLVMTHVNHKMHKSIDVKPWWIKVLKEDELSQSIYNLLGSMQI